MGFNLQERIHAGISFDRSLLPPHRTSLVDLPSGSTELWFRRDRSSHRGIHRFGRLRRLWLYSVNQEFLQELADIPAIEQLFIDGLTATDVTPLQRLRHLRRLVLIGGTKIESLDWLAGLAPLETLALENFKRVFDLGALASHTSLTALGVEGSIWTRMRVVTLAPLAGLYRLRSLFLTHLTAADHSLRPLHSLSDLQLLEIGALFPDDELVRLRQALPKLRCDWFEIIDRYGSTRKGISSNRSRNKLTFRFMPQRPPWSSSETGKKSQSANLGISTMPLTTSQVAREASPTKQGNRIQGRRTSASAGATMVTWLFTK
jgi:hypothetical protein